MLPLLQIVMVAAAPTVSSVTIHLLKAADEATVKERDLRMLQMLEKAPRQPRKAWRWSTQTEKSQVSPEPTKSGPFPAEPTKSLHI